MVGIERFTCAALKKSVFLSLAEREAIFPSPVTSLSLVTKVARLPYSALLPCVAEYRMIIQQWTDAHIIMLHVGAMSYLDDRLSTRCLLCRSW